jgi:hypothetical protein
MIITSDQIAKELRARWPHIYLPWMTDRQFIAPALDEMKAAVARHSVADVGIIDNICECEDLSDQLNARIHWERIQQAHSGRIPKTEHWSWAFGITFGTQFFGWADSHVCNIGYTESGLYLIEPQHDTFWIPNSEDDKIIIAKI